LALLVSLGGCASKAPIETATSPSCQGLPSICGTSGRASCCASTPIPQGTFLRGYDGVSPTYMDQTYPATVSAFSLDTYEITVGRFRRFVAAYPGALPATAAGKNPRDSTDPGWDVMWNALLPADGSALTSAIQCDASHQTWTDSPGDGDLLPMNCITWYEAFAFCAWDGGRLPSEAEWNYVSAGGSEQRAYPWSMPSTALTIDDSYANYCGDSCAGIENVGAKSPRGDSRWGIADVSGNVAEWVLDGDGSWTTTCVDCADTSDAINRVFRGGSFHDDASYLLSSSRLTIGKLDRTAQIGARCARDP
jgi:formylglycine-generating enzyme required for sulfatase activity